MHRNQQTQEGLHVKNKRSVMQSLIFITQFGISMIVPILLCTFLGVYLGRRFDKPILAVPLFLIGAAAGFRNVYRLAKKTYEDKDGGNAKKTQ